MDEQNEMPTEIDAIAEIDWRALAKEAGVRLHSHSPGTAVDCLRPHLSFFCDCRAVREDGVLQLWCSNLDCNQKLCEKNALLKELSREAIRAVRRAAEIREELRYLDCSQDGAADLLATPLVIALDRCLHVLAAKATDDPKHARALRDIRELARLRRGDHSQKRLRFERERWENELKLKLLTLISNGPKQPGFSLELLTKTLVEMRGNVIKKRYAERKKRGSLSAQEETHYKEALAKIARWRDDIREALANLHVLLAGAGSLDPEPFYNQGEST
jgi:hypothetical protein